MFSIIHHINEIKVDGYGDAQQFAVDGLLAIANGERL